MNDNTEQRRSTDTKDLKEIARQDGATDQASVALPDIPSFTLGFDPSQIIGDSAQDRVKKRASNILKLTEENEKLKADLKAVTERLEAAERRREELARKEQKLMEERTR
ncbi:hypothetical protein JOM56_003592 [Amanita muscaria]